MQKEAYDMNFGRRDFLAAMSGAAGALALAPLGIQEANAAPEVGKKAVVRTVFLYPPSATFSEDPNGWWSWPGNEYDAEGRQKKYTKALREMEGLLAERGWRDDR